MKSTVNCIVITSTWLFKQCHILPLTLNDNVKLYNSYRFTRVKDEYCYLLLSKYTRFTPQLLVLSEFILFYVVNCMLMLLQSMIFLVVDCKKILQLVLVVHPQTTTLCCGMLSSLGAFS